MKPLFNALLCNFFSMVKHHEIERKVSLIVDYYCFDIPLGLLKEKNLQKLESSQLVMLEVNFQY